MERIQSLINNFEVVTVPRRLFLMLAGAALLLCASLLAMTTSQSEASARAVTKACIDAANAKAQRENAFAISAPQDPKHAAEIRRCIDVRQWDMGRIRVAGFVAACGVGFLAFAFGFLQRQAPA